ncbi:uncharacterized protein LOC142491033 isoform X2 [Ascaphus truei]|uniref:uncharacterized protein LOC142491033 isoform X2 n=1 Tax=Ascaphus truei TaxID=8439 RepID=UPI003F5985E3
MLNCWNLPSKGPTYNKKTTVFTMNIQCVAIFYCVCICHIINIPKTCCRNITLPRITDPQNNISLEVQPGSQVNIGCSAILENRPDFMDQQLMYWLVNGNFPDNDTKVREEDVTEIELDCYDFGIFIFFTLHFTDIFCLQTFQTRQCPFILSIAK